MPYKQLPFDHPLYILYSSGTTGVPKCIVHCAGGVLLQHLKEHILHVDVKLGDRLFYFTTMGWMLWNWLTTGLASGATVMLYDGSPFHPEWQCALGLCGGAQVQGLRRFGKVLLRAARRAGSIRRPLMILSELKTILSTGSVLLPEGFDYVYEHVKEDVCLASIAGGTDLVACLVGGDPTSAGISR